MRGENFCSVAFKFSGNEKRLQQEVFHSHCSFSYTNNCLHSYRKCVQQSINTLQMNDEWLILKHERQKTILSSNFVYIYTNAPPSAKPGLCGQFKQHLCDLFVFRIILHFEEIFLRRKKIFISLKLSKHFDWNLKRKKICINFCLLYKHDWT